MVHYFIYAKDCSDLINRAEYYQSNELKTREQFKCDVEKIKEQLVTQEPPRQLKIVYLDWGDVCWDVNEDRAGIKDDSLVQVSENVTRTSSIDICERKNRDPGCIVWHLRRKYIINENDKIKLLYIVTNGMITRECRYECLVLNKDMHYETVVFHAFNEDPEKIDLSVGAPFFKSRCIVYRNNELYDSTDISKEFDYDKVYSDNFEAEMQKIKSYIKLKFINKFERDADVWREVKKLDHLKFRILRELLEISTEPKCPFFELSFEPRRRKILTFHEDKDEKDVIMTCDMEIDPKKYVSILNSYIKNNEKSCSFDVVNFDTKVNPSQEDFNYGSLLEEEEDDEYDIFSLSEE